jgi:hypothetical protein
MTKQGITPGPQAAPLALRPPGGQSTLDEVRIQKLWIATQRRQWGSLAVVAARRALDTLPVAETFSKIAWWYSGEPSCVFDLRDLSLRLVEYQVSEVQAQVQSGARVIIALRSIFENPTAIPIARQADAVALCITMGSTDFKSAEETIEEIGRERVLGTIVLREARSKGRTGAPRGNGR